MMIINFLQSIDLSVPTTMIISLIMLFTITTVFNTATVFMLNESPIGWIIIPIKFFILCFCIYYILGFTIIKTLLVTIIIALVADVISCPIIVMSVLSTIRDKIYYLYFVSKKDRFQNKD